VPVNPDIHIRSESGSFLDHADLVMDYLIRNGKLETR